MKTIFSNLLRSFGILFYTDKLRFYLHYLRRYCRNNSFVKENPSVPLPAAHLMYESFDLDYKKYYFDSIITAKWLINHFKKHKELKDINILDWGCGPARIIRHLPIILDKSCELYGTDYNPKSITWNRKNFTNINFNLNTISPPLSYVSNSFDVIYGISIFTHLSEDLHYSWFNELVRISKDGGIIFLTLHGNAFKTKLTSDERQQFEKGLIVVKGNTKIGHRTFTAFHPMLFINELFKEHKILEHIEGVISIGKPQQDIWIVKVVK